ncbi:MAG: YdcF family protein [Gemmatimonadaceae bacterium]
MASRSTAFSRTMLGVVGLALAVWAASAVLVVYWGSRDEAGKADAIVVLGAAQYVGRPSPVLRARLDHAIDLYERGYAPLLVLTGGVGEGDTTSEAAVGRRYAYRAGVPEDAILTEEHGRTTAESLYAVSAMLHERGVTRVILVSDPFHVLRLRVLADRLDLHPMTSPTRTSPISASRQERWSYVVSESVKVPLTFLLGDVADRIIAPDVPPLDSILRR